MWWCLPPSSHTRTCGKWQVVWDARAGGSCTSGASLTRSPRERVSRLPMLGGDLHARVVDTHRQHRTCRVRRRLIRRRRSGGLLTTAASVGYADGVQGVAGGLAMDGAQPALGAESVGVGAISGLVAAQDDGGDNDQRPLYVVRNQREEGEGTNEAFGIPWSWLTCNGVDGVCEVSMIGEGLLGSFQKVVVM
jgi:hypothetical protein